jgi:hypothetical protein
MDKEPERTAAGFGRLTIADWRVSLTLSPSLPPLHRTEAEIAALRDVTRELTND